MRGVRDRRLTIPGARDCDSDAVVDCDINGSARLNRLAHSRAHSRALVPVFCAEGCDGKINRSVDDGFARPGGRLYTSAICARRVQPADVEPSRHPAPSLLRPAVPHLRTTLSIQACRSARLARFVACRVDMLGCRGCRLHRGARHRSPDISRCAGGDVVRFRDRARRSTGRGWEGLDFPAVWPVLEAAHP